MSARAPVPDSPIRRGWQASALGRDMPCWGMCGQFLGGPCPNTPTSGRLGGRRAVSLKGWCPLAGSVPLAQGLRPPSDRRDAGPQGAVPSQPVRTGRGRAPSSGVVVNLSVWSGLGQGSGLPSEAFTVATSQAISLNSRGMGFDRPHCLCFPAFGCADLGRPSRAAYPPLCRPGATAPVLTGKAPPVRTAPGRCGHPSRLRDGNPALPHHCRSQGCSPHLTRPCRSAPRRKMQDIGFCDPPAFVERSDQMATEERSEDRSPARSRPEEPQQPITLELVALLTPTAPARPIN